MLPFSEACERNKLPILDILRTRLRERQVVLEIGSGTGQHAVYFAAQLPQVTWHPTEQLPYLDDLNQRVLLEGGTNLKIPLQLDVKQAVWPLRTADAVFTANTLHIMSWAEVGALFTGIGTMLSAGGLFCVYGPFRYHGRFTSPSNEEFDLMLRDRDPQSGVRDIEAVTALAHADGLRLDVDHELPAFNRLLIFVKEPL